MTPGPERRPTLTVDTVVSAAVTIADESGLDRLTMRGLSAALGVEAASLYHHVRGKDELLAAMVDAVFAEVGPPAGDDWRAAMRARCQRLRAALMHHPWAVGVLESGTTPGPAALRHHDAVVGCLTGGGLPMAVVGRAYVLLDSYVYGFVIQERALPADGAAQTEEVARAMLEALPADTYPHLAAFTAGYVLRPGFHIGSEFEVGLDMLLDGVARSDGS